MRNTNDPQTARICRAGFALFALSVISWSIDGLACSQLQRLPYNLPNLQLHAWGWHGGVSAATYGSSSSSSSHKCVLLSSAPLAVKLAAAVMAVLIPVATSQATFFTPINCGSQEHTHNTSDALNAACTAVVICSQCSAVTTAFSGTYALSLLHHAVAACDCAHSCTLLQSSSLISSGHTAITAATSSEAQHCWCC
eukprot:20596-Heterococcus_DN1.PRE.2